MAKVRFTVFETSLIVLLAALATWSFVGSRNPFADYRDPEIASIEKRYGPDHWSAGPEEWLIRDYFADRRNGVFLDIGAAHYRDDSNTYFLETALGWSGIAVDALDTWADGYRQHRPRTQFYNFFIADRSDATASVFVNPLDRRLSSSTREMPASRGPTLEQKVPTITLTDLLTAAKLTRIDFMSMDIELSEPAALKGFDIETFRPALVCIEAHAEVRQAIIDYFAAHGYRVVGRYLRADRANLYFAPPP
jgi:FkbM family methyltransferase